MDRKANHPRPMTRRELLKAGGVLATGAGFSRAAWSETALAAPGNASLAQLTTAVQPTAPEWIKNLIVYEIATRGFTSPRGPESGSFASLRAKLPYLQELGITGIWLSGYSLCDPHHFYNIWTQYAVIDPEKFDPALGTGEEFEALIEDAHRRGIKVFLDVITHGLMNDSPIVREHRAWFRGGTWGMTDYDWTGGHTDLDDWWVKIYTDFVTRYQVDGYRLDVAIYRPDLWERIRQNAAAAGHPVVIWEELNAVIPGVTDFTQRENTIYLTGARRLNPILARDLPGFYDRMFGRAGYYHVEVKYHDGRRIEGDTNHQGELKVQLAGLGTDKVGRRFGSEGRKPDGLPDVVLALSGVERSPIANISVRNEMDDVWELRSPDSRPIYLEDEATFGPTIVGPEVKIHLGALCWGSSIQLSCHDQGWMNFPKDANPFVAQGSRSLFGYSFLFSPLIPIFFSGEEFNAEFHPLPGLSPDLYGGTDPGTGRWLYGAQLDWSELEEPPHQQMLRDVKRMIAIRRQYSGILAMCPGGTEPNLCAVEYKTDIEVPAPYIRWKDNLFILIAGNQNPDRDAEVTVSFPAEFLQRSQNFRVRDLWSDTAERVLRRQELLKFRFPVKRDKAPGGGLAVFALSY